MSTISVFFSSTAEDEATPPDRKISCGRIALALACLTLLSGTPALADLKLCNTTSSRVGVALGYQDKSGWSTEGWWNIPSQACETLLKGGLPSRFIYVHAIDYDRGGEWAGTNYMCTQEKSFMVHGVQDCQKRGFKRSGYFEVDTGDSRDWTIRLSDPDETTKSR